MDIPPADPNVCPDCRAAIGPSDRECPACRLPLRGPAALELWNVTVQLNNLAARREGLLRSLRTTPAAPRPVAAPPPPAWGPPARSPVAWTPPAPKPRREWTAQRVQNLVLSLGALLLVVSAVIFAVVNWSDLGIGWRALILGSLTVGVGWGAYELHRRALTATAEALGTLTLALLFLDAYAVRRLGLAGLDEPRGAWFWAGAVGAVSVVAGAYATVLPLRVLRWSAALGVQLPVPIALLDADVGASTASVVLTAQAAVAVTVARLKAGWAAAAGAAATATVAFPPAMFDAFVEDARPGAAALVALALLAALTSWLYREQQAVRAAGSGTATALLLVAVWAVGRAELVPSQLPALHAAAGLLAVVASAALPMSWRRPPMAVGAAGVAYAVLLVAEHALTGLFGPYGWLDRPWTLAAGAPARGALSPGLAWEGTVVVLVVMLVAAATALLVAELGGRREVVALPVTLTVALAVLLVPLGQAWSYRAAIGWDVAVGSALVASVVPLRRHRALTANALYVSGLVVLGSTVAWSLADQGATVAVLGLAAALLAVASALDEFTSSVSASLATALANGWVVALALSRGTPADRSGFVLALAGAACVVGGLYARRLGYAVAAVGALSYAVGTAIASADPGWLSWALAAGAVAAAALLAVLEAAVRPAAAAGSAGLACAWAYTFAISRDTPVDRAGFCLALAGCLAVGLGALAGRYDRAAGDAVEVAGAVAYGCSLLPSAAGLGWFSWTLAAGGLSALADALRPERRAVAWAGGLLLSAWSWTRLWLADVRAPEAYAAPIAATALVLGHLRRRADETVGSWAAYGPGLLAALGPSLFVALDDPGLARPLLLGLVALAVVLWGARERLQAPLVVGGITLAVDAAVQAAPYVGGLPRWIPIGAAGILLTVVGVTFEQRRRDLERLRDTFDAMT